MLDQPDTPVITAPVAYKTCRTCGTTQPLTTEFWNKNQHTWQSRCRKCRAKARSVDYKRRGRTPQTKDCTTPERLRRFQLTVETHAELLKTQDHKCPICTKAVTDKCPIDHCHDTGRVRGVLCYGCNNGLGAFKDNALNLFKAYSYLMESL